MNYDTIRLEKGLYQTGTGFTKALEELDPTPAYRGTELEGMDAYQRQLKRFDIKVSGAGSDVVDKFFKTSDSAALFPEYVARAVRQGMEAEDLLPKVIATTTQIDGMDYRTITSQPGSEDKELKEVAEGAAIPETKITVQENLVKLKKRGRMLVASYEAIRFQRLDLFTVMLRQIGAYISRQQFMDAVTVLLEGDGNANPISTVAPATPGQITYGDLVKFWNQFQPYEMNTLLATPDVAQKLLTMEEFRDAPAGLDFHGTGKLITPLGAELVRLPTGEEGLIGLDRRCALEKVQAGEVLIDYDKLIDRQLERAAISCIAGFAKIFPDSAKQLLLTA